MAMSRTTSTVLAMSTAVLLAGCSDADSTVGPEPGSPAPTPDAAVVWANSVCSASTDLQASVRDAGDALQSDLSPPAPSLEQAKAEMRGHVDALRQSAAALAGTLSGMPAGADAQSAVRSELETASQGAQAAVEQLRTAAGQVAEAQTASELAAGLATLKSALTRTAAGLTTYLESLRGTVGAREQAARDSFGAAPACQELTASPTASP
jgi:hypothetical protein